MTPEYPAGEDIAGEWDGVVSRLPPWLRIGAKGELLELESTIWATFMRSTPTRRWMASTVARCSGGYSRMSNLTSECAARYISRWGMMRVARR